MSQRLEKGYLLGGQANLLYPVKEVFALLQTKRTIFLTGLDQRLPGLTVNEKFSFTVKNVNSYQNSFDFLIKDLTRWKKEGYRVVLLSASRTRASRLASDLRDYDLHAYCLDLPGTEKESTISETKESTTSETKTTGTFTDKKTTHKIRPGEILVTYGNLHRGFEYPLLKFVMITEGDMFGTEKKRKRKKKPSYEGRKIQNF